VDITVYEARPDRPQPPCTKRDECWLICFQDGTHKRPAFGGVEFSRDAAIAKVAYLQREYPGDQRHCVVHVPASP
jgi:hypothetical protein